MVTKQIFKIGGMHCSSCAMAIDGELEDMEGIKESNTNFAKGTTEVKYDDAKTSEKEIAELIKKIGYKIE